MPRSLLRRALDEGRAEHEGWRLRPDGSQLWASVCVYSISGGFALIERDLTDRHEAELALEEQREMLGAVLYSANDAVISADPAGRITLFTPAAERVFGHAAKAMLGTPLDALLPLRHRSHHSEDMRSFAGSQVSRRAMGAGRVKGLHADGHEIDLEASISQATVRGQKVLTAILRDVTIRVRAEEALVRYQLELSDLTQQLMAQEKATTRRLAQTLHDQLGQTRSEILPAEARCR